MNTIDINDLFGRATDLRRNHDYEAAYQHFLAFIDGASKDDARLVEAYRLALLCLTRQRRWHEAAELSRRVIIALPDSGIGYSGLGEAMIQLDRPAEAAHALRSAVAVDPENTSDARVLLALLRPQGLHSKPPTVRSWPSRTSSFLESPAELVRRYVLKGLPSAQIIGEDTSFSTIGSCFARNLGEHLAQAKRRVYFEAIGEEVNSTFANKYLFDWVANGVTNRNTELMRSVYGEEMRIRLREQIARSNVVVLTLGVAACFFDRTSSEFVYAPSHLVTARRMLNETSLMRTTSVPENVENVRAIIATIRRLNPGQVAIVLTVSPVPMAGTTEMSSAVMADCISKSTLRLACQEVLAGKEETERVFYWPSFEIVRWLGPHFGGEWAPVFGQEDQNSRHVSDWIVALNVNLFLEHFARPGSLN
jgi:hypothetical protein